MKSIYTFTLLISILISTSSMAQWEQRASLPSGTERNHPVNFVLNSKAYHVTGYNASAGLMKDFYEYDPSNDSWTKKTDFPGAARGFAYGVDLDGKGYMGFGISSTAYLNDFWEYDPNSDSWKQLASCPCTGRRHPAFVGLNGKIYVGLGDDANGNLKDWWIYDVATNSWKKGPDFPSSRRHHPYYFGIGNDVYVGFGHGAGIYNDFYKFDVVTEQWSTLKVFPGEARVAGTQQSNNGKGYIISGEGSDHQNLDYGEFYEYEPSTDSWTELDPHPGIGRWALGSFIIDDYVYITSGEGNGLVDQRDLWRYPLNTSTSVSEVNNEISSFEVYPNPVRNELYLPMDLLSNREAQVIIYSLAGQEVLRTNVSSNRLSTDNLTKGFYVISLQDSKGNIYQSRFIKE